MSNILLKSQGVIAIGATLETHNGFPPETVQELSDKEFLLAARMGGFHGLCFLENSIQRNYIEVPIITEIKIETNLLGKTFVHLKMTSSPASASNVQSTEQENMSEISEEKKYRMALLGKIRTQPSGLSFENHQPIAKIVKPKEYSLSLKCKKTVVVSRMNDSLNIFSMIEGAVNQNLIEEDEVI